MRLRCTALALLAVVALRAEDERGAPTREFLDQKAELEGLVSKRDTELYELTFEPATDVGQVTLTDRAGRVATWHYLTFRVRNEAQSDPAKMATRAKGYNEVLQALAQQYENTKPTADGSGLRVDGVEGQDGVIVERQEAKPKTRTLSLSVLAWDEDGTRLKILGGAYRSARGEAESSAAGFSFPDHGSPQAGSVMRAVRERIEEVEGRRLLSVDELRSFPLPPFDPQQRIEAKDITDPMHDFNGWRIGEAYGVIIFSELNLQGDRFSVQINGLSNKLRFRAPAGTPDKPENYFAAKILRRAWVMRFLRPGDADTHKNQRFQLTDSGWTWTESFQRVDVRRTAAYARWILDRITDRPDRIDPEVESRFWPWYETARAKTPDKLPELKRGEGP